MTFFEVIMFLFSLTKAKIRENASAELIVTFICNLRYRCHNVDVKFAFTANTALLRPSSLNNAVRTVVSTRSSGRYMGF